MKIKTSWLAGKYQLTRKSWDCVKDKECEENIAVNLTACEAKTLMKRKKNGDSLYDKLGFNSIMLVKE